MNTTAENLQTTGFVLGVLKSAEFYLQSGSHNSEVQALINKLLDEKMKYVRIKRLAKKHRIMIDWNALDITIKRTD